MLKKKESLGFKSMNEVANKNGGQTMYSTIHYINEKFILDENGIIDLSYKQPQKKFIYNFNMTPFGQGVNDGQTVHIINTNTEFFQMNIPTREGKEFLDFLVQNGYHLSLKKLVGLFDSRTLTALIGMCAINKQNIYLILKDLSRKFYYKPGADEYRWLVYPKKGLPKDSDLQFLWQNRSPKVISHYLKLGVKPEIHANSPISDTAYRLIHNYLPSDFKLNCLKCQDTILHRLQILFGKHPYYSFTELQLSDSTYIYNEFPSINAHFRITGGYQFLPACVYRRMELSTLMYTENIDLMCKMIKNVPPTDVQELQLCKIISMLIVTKDDFYLKYLKILLEDFNCCVFSLYAKTICGLKFQGGYESEMLFYAAGKIDEKNARSHNRSCVYPECIFRKSSKTIKT
jgi:hypothetical protein